MKPGSLATNCFYKAPVFAQNLAVSLKGFFEYRNRYSEGVIIDAPDQLTEEELKRQQKKLLNGIINYACDNVPYYSELLKDKRFSADDITPNNLPSYFPVIEKEFLLKNQHLFYTQSENNLKSLFTSGTTGSPLHVKYTPDARKLNYAFYEMILRQYGCHYKSRSATFGGRDFLPPDPGTVFWRKDNYNNTLYMSSYHISVKTIPYYTEMLFHWKPDFIDTYPSAIFEIAKHVMQNGIAPPHPPKFILTSSETLTYEQKATIEAAFDTIVVDHYGCTEMATMAYLTESGYFFDPRYSYVELEDTDDPCTKSVVCTGLINKAMPLIRFRIGDMVEVYSKEIFDEKFLVKRIAGRMDDIIVTPDGRHIGRMDPVFKGLEGISRAQIRQTSVDCLRILIEERFSGSYTSSEHRKLLNNIRTRLGDDISIQVQTVNSIPLSRSGKFRQVISELNQASFR
jgi:phenylacetate-CoA ligase